jgi:hypothetical protein
MGIENTIVKCQSSNPDSNVFFKPEKFAFHCYMLTTNPVFPTYSIYRLRTGTVMYKIGPTDVPVPVAMQLGDRRI